MPRILQLRASGQLLGAERVVLELANFLPEFGHDVIIGIPVEPHQPFPDFAKEAKEKGYETICFPISSAFDLSIVKHIKEYVRKNDIDIIHSHGYREDFYAWLAKSGAKLIATNHLWKRTTFRLKVYAALDAWLLKKFDAIIAVSAPVKDDMARVGIPIQKTKLISNGIDTTIYSKPINQNDARQSLSLPNEHIIIGSLGSLTIEKGIDLLTRAFKEVHNQHPNIHLLITGEGPEKESLASLVEELELTEHVTFSGRRSDINNIFSAIDIFALPSLNEGLPMAMLEAMAAGKAIIASDVGDVSTALIPGTGILVRASETSDLRDALTQLIITPSLIKELGKKAKQRVSEHFSASSMAKQYAQTYNNTLSSDQV